MSIADDKFIKSSIEALEKSIEYFCPENQKERDLYVAEKFLRNLKIEFKNEELITPADDPPDVVFRNARFEIKELMDKDRRRHAEFKAELKRCKSSAVTKAVDIFKDSPYKEIQIQEIFDSTIKILEKYKIHYARSFVASLDLLIYVNLLDVYVVHMTPFPDVQTLSDYGWRSISYVEGQNSCCFYASESAPSFIKQIVGKVEGLYP